MLGSSISVAGPNIVLNTAVAEALSQFSEILKDVPAEEMDAAVRKLVKDTVIAHKRIVFNGNGYTDEWVAEAEKRGLYNLKSTPEALPVFKAEKNVKLFTSHHIFTETEIFSRYEILLENYVKTIHIEAKTLYSMVEQQFMPALLHYTDTLSSSIADKKAVADLPCTAETALLKDISAAYESLYTLSEKLAADTAEAEGLTDNAKASFFYHDTIIKDMDDIRAVADKAEVKLPKEFYLTLPTRRCCSMYSLADDDKLHEECGVFGIFTPDNKDAKHSLYYGLCALQHRGQESAGMALCDTDGPMGNIYHHKGMGLVSEVFHKETLDTLTGNIGIGHVRYSTTGQSCIENAQPLILNYLKGTLALVHNGNIKNAAELRDSLQKEGAIFRGTTDSEVIAYLIAKERTKCGTIEEAVTKVAGFLKGGYALIVMSPRKIIGIRDPLGLKPLCLGRRGNEYILSSESCALNAIDAEFVRDIEPGES